LLWFNILATHFLIDRFRLAKVWVESPWYADGGGRPDYISFWIIVVVDNTFHLVINSFTIYLSFVS